MFKDECNGIYITEFIGLHPKMYLLIKEDDDETNPKHGTGKAKEVPLKVVKKEFNHNHYKEVLFNPKYNNTVKFQTIGSDRHHIHSVEITKVGLSSIDDKKWIDVDNITILAYSDYQLQQTR